MSDFLVIIPDGWIQLDWQYITNNVPGMSKAGVEAVVSGGAYYDMEATLKEYGIIPADKSLVEAKLIDDTYFLVRLG